MTYSQTLQITGRRAQQSAVQVWHVVRAIAVTLAAIACLAALLTYRAATSEQAHRLYRALWHGFIVACGLCLLAGRALRSYCDRVVDESLEDAPKESGRGSGRIELPDWVALRKKSATVVLDLADEVVMNLLEMASNATDEWIRVSKASYAALGR